MGVLLVSLEGRRFEALTPFVGAFLLTMIAALLLGIFAGIASRPAGRPPRLVLLLGGFFVLTVGGLGLRGATALLGDDVVSGFGPLDQPPRAPECSSDRSRRTWVTRVTT